MTDKSSTTQLDTSVSYQLGEIKGLLAGIMNEMAAARDRAKGFDALMADHERRISQIEATQPSPRITAMERSVQQIEARFKIYVGLIAGGCTVAAFAIREILVYIK